MSESRKLSNLMNVNDSVSISMVNYWFTLGDGTRETLKNHFRVAKQYFEKLDCEGNIVEAVVATNDAVVVTVELLEGAAVVVAAAFVEIVPVVLLNRNTFLKKML